MTDLNMQILAEASNALQADYVKDADPWEGSPFSWITKLPSRSKGAVFEKLVSRFLAANGFNVANSPDTDADRVINGLRVEIKGSTLWKNGQYRFQQLRDQNYDVAICLGISPFAVHCWVLPKSVIMEKRGTRELPSQHGGQRGSDTAWLTVRPYSVQDWLLPYGGTLDEAVDILRRVERLE